MNINADEIIKNLTTREKEILKKRFDIDFEDLDSFNKLKDKMLEVSVEKIKEIEERALKKLRDSNESE